MTDNDDDDDDSDVGEGFEFDTVKVTETLFRAYGLSDEAKRRSVELGISYDGAQLFNTVLHVAVGLMFNDVAMRDPTIKSQCYFIFPDSLVPSRNLCFPLRIVIAKDDNKTLEGFRSLYDSVNTGDVAEALDCQPFKMLFPGNMKLQWGALDEGSAAKVKEKFCPIIIHSNSTGQDKMSVEHKQKGCKLQVGLSCCRGTHDIKDSTHTVRYYLLEDRVHVFVGFEPQPHL
jgi:hypothetical protein